MPTLPLLVSPLRPFISVLVASLACSACGSGNGVSPARTGGLSDAGVGDVAAYPADVMQSDAGSYPADATGFDAAQLDATLSGAGTYPDATGSDVTQPDATQLDARSYPADAVQPDATPPDAGSCVGAFVCDDFERYAVGTAPPSPWTVAANVGTVAVDSTRSHSGARSVKVTAPAATGYRSVMLRIAGGGLLPVAGNSVYGRMMFWLDSSPTMTVHWTFVDGSGLVAGTAYHAVYRYGGQLPLTAADGGFLGSQLMASYDTTDSYTGVGPATDCFQHSKSRPVPVGAWTCIEWQFDGPNDTTRFWLNGAPVPDLTVSHTGAGCVSQPAGYEWASPTISQVDVGWESYQADDARTMWIDDVAFGTTRIGCP
ncbi:MAG TPA: hypothetical protein VN894_02985 [Polyangiaceae bacterium]|nr:hypothetical protein [Polyangiaceae bacterium]